MERQLKAALYLRVSTKVQDEEQQEPDLRRQAKQDNAEILFTFRDKISGLKSEKERDGLNELLKLTKKDIDIVYIWEISRLSRNPHHFSTLIEHFKENQINICFLKPNLLYLFNKTTGETDLTNSIILSIFSQFALFEIEQKGERTKRGKRAAILDKEHSYTSKPPYGYKVVNKKLYLNDKIISDYIGYETEPEVVKSIYNLYNSGKTLSQIKAVLNDYKLPTRSKDFLKKDTLQITKGKEIDKDKIQWNRRSIHAILTNSIYYGKKEINNFKKEKDSDGKETKIRLKYQEIVTPAIITESEFLLAQKQKKNNISVASKTYKNEFLLRGLLKCGFCGKQYLGSGSKGNNYYLCSDKTHRRSNTFTGCKNTIITVKIDSIIWELTKAAFISNKHKENIEVRIAEIDAEISNKKLLLANKANDINLLDSRIRNLTERLSRVPEDLITNVLNSMNELSEQRTKLIDETNTIKTDISKLLNQQNNIKNSGNDNPLLELSSLDFSSKCVEIKKILESVEIFKINSQFRVLRLFFKSGYINNIIYNNRNSEYVECSESLFKYIPEQKRFEHRGYSDLNQFSFNSELRQVSAENLFNELIIADKLQLERDKRN